ncbi:MAG: DUF2742 domain-containing protein [Mycobacterium sp.]
MAGTSRQVAYLPVYEMLLPLLGDPGLVPGTPQWCALADDNPDKWRAVLWSAVWWALSEDVRQASLVDASHEIACGTDMNWHALARRVVQGRGSAYMPRQPKEVA